MTSEVLTEILSIKKILENQSSPRLSEREACKYLRIGKDKLRKEIIVGRLRKRKDRFGSSYFLRDELYNYLKGEH